MKRLLLLFCAASLALAGAARAADVTAELDPAQVAVGEPAQLTVTVTGSSTAAPFIPNIPGLQIEHVGQSTQIQIINGSMTSSAVHTYELTPQRAGAFTIPAIQAGGGRSTPLTLRASGSGQPSAALPAPNVPLPQADAAASADARYGYIRIVAPKKQFYVGELAPVEVSAYIPAGLQATVDGIPTLSSEAFTLNPLGNKPDQEEREINGRDYTVLTWHSALTAVKAGEYSLGMQMPLTVVVRERQQARQQMSNDPFDQFFDDPFSGNPFAALGRKKQITLASEPDAMTVQALPAANRPADFRGAVGHFAVRASASPTSAAAGDPITLRLEVTGSGDFDRVTSDGLANDAQWKTYPPKATFEPADSAGFKGAKTFEQVIMAHDASTKEIPALRFSYFDPETKRYETRSTTPIPTAITGAAPVVTAAPIPSAVDAPAAPDLAPNKVEPGRFISTLRPIFLDPWFLAALGIPILALIGATAFIRRRRRFAADPNLARASAADRAIHAQLDRMDSATREHSAADFFVSARGALQQRLGERWGVAPETITLAEVSARLNGSGEAIRPVFEMADEISYSGQSFGDADYRLWKDLVVSQLEHLEEHP